MKRRIWLIADTHFNHPQMIRDCGRPHDFEERIWKELSGIPEQDILVHLGDICIGEDKNIHDRLRQYKFTKILVKGNHDNKSNNWYLNHGWDFVCKQFTDRYFKKRILFSHEPRAEEENYDLNIHAHFHNISEAYHEEELVAVKNDKQKLLALEYIGYNPILLERFIMRNYKLQYTNPK